MKKSVKCVLPASLVRRLDLYAEHRKLSRTATVALLLRKDFETADTRAVEDVGYMKPYHTTYVDRSAGEGNVKAKLTAEDVYAIRARYARRETCAAIAKDYGMSKHTITQIVSRRSWQHLIEPYHTVEQADG